MHLSRDKIYEEAFAAYEKDDYSRARTLFTELTLQSPFEDKYWRGLGSSQQMLGCYEEALHAWAMVALMTNGDPVPHLHAAECYLLMGNKEDAKKALSTLDHLVQAHPNPELILERKLELEGVL